jgi:signal transduction histidine kinase
MGHFLPSNHSFIFNNFIISQYIYKVNKKGFQSQKRGSGLGLAIVKEIVELHGGRVYQKNLEQGSEFAFELNKET